MKVGTRVAVVALLTACTMSVARFGDGAQSSRTIHLRDRDEVLRLYGPPSGRPVIISSGDGGWVHLGPHVAETLAAKGFFVVGFDAKAYLESFTDSAHTLSINDEPRDYKALIDFAMRRGDVAGPKGPPYDSTDKPVLIGVSEGAGLSVLAATDPGNKRAIAGVLALGLADRTELAWRWQDSLIYVTHGAAREPFFKVSGLVDRMAPAPLAAIHSTHDEFAPLAQVQTVLNRAGDPKRLWVVDADNHRFSGKVDEFDRDLLDAVTWITSQSANAPR